MFKIEEYLIPSWGDKSKSVKVGRHIYETEKTFKRYWKFHSKNIDQRGSNKYGIIAYHNGNEIGRYGKIDDNQYDKQPDLS
jgi:hypothetical protein